MDGPRGSSRLSRGRSGRKIGSDEHGGADAGAAGGPPTPRWGEAALADESRTSVAPWDDEDERRLPT